MEKKTNYEKLNDLSNELPAFCDNFLFNGNSEHSSITSLNYAFDIKHFFEFGLEYFPFFEGKQIKELTIDDMKQITPGNINMYLTIMKEKYEYSDKTRARRKSSISCLFKYLTDTERLLDFNPVSGSSKVKVHENDFVTYLKRGDQEKLLNCIKYGTGLTKKQLAFHEKEKKRDYALIFLILDTGLRISEVRSINIKDLDFDDCCLYVIRKGGKTEKVFFSDESALYIQEYLDERMNTYGYLVDDPLFLSGQGHRIAVRTIQAMLEKYIKATFPQKSKNITDEEKKKEKRKNISPHKLRASFAMDFYKQSKDILLLKERMGHKSIVATNIYAKASEEEMIRESRNWRNEDGKGKQEK